MISFFKNLFTPKIETVSMRVARELHEAEMDLLRAQREREYWCSMTTMLDQRINRLLAIKRCDNNP